MSQSKRWCFTLNNYTSDEVKAIKAKFEDPAVDLRYGIIGHEVGDNGTPHLQDTVPLIRTFVLKESKPSLASVPMSK